MPLAFAPAAGFWPDGTLAPYAIDANQRYNLAPAIKITEISLLDPNMHRIETLAEQSARSNAEHHGRLRDLTRLEQAAYKERKVLGEEFERPYTNQERAEAEGIQSAQLGPPPSVNTLFSAATCRIAAQYPANHSDILCTLNYQISHSENSPILRGRYPSPAWRCDPQDSPASTRLS